LPYPYSDLDFEIKYEIKILFKPLINCKNFKNSIVTKDIFILKHREYKTITRVVRVGITNTQESAAAPPDQLHFLISILVQFFHRCLTCGNESF
jgi:hypothetical protein